MYGKRILPTLLGLTSLCAYAAEPDFGDTVQLNGFAAQSLISTTNNNLFGDTRDSLDAGLTEIGINLNWRATPSLYLAGQVLFRRAGEADEEGLRLDYASLDWTPWQTPSTTVGLRIGKIKVPYGLYNETRDVPASRPGILLPQSIYFDTSRDFALGGYGAALHGEWLFEDSSVELILSMAQPDASSESVEYNVFSAPQAGELEGDRANIAQARWNLNEGRTTLAVTYLNIYLDYAPGTADPLGPGRVKISPWWVFSASHAIGPFTLTTEYAPAHPSLQGFGAALPDTKVNGEAWYVQGTWRFLPSWELLARYDVFHYDRDDPDGSSFEALTGLPGHTRYARDLTLGIRWDVSADWLLRAEWHHVDGTAWLSGPDNPDLFAREARWNAILLQAGWRF
jgi:hypothetical protein